MNADTLITGISQLVTGAGSGPKHGSAMRELKIVESAAIAISSGLIVWTGRVSEWTGMAETIINAGGRAVVP
jgi:imidazolonepropionase-like amidohydrolase